MDNEESTIDKGMPAHLWEKIFEFIPKKDREHIPQVNSLFYEIICFMDRYKKVLEVTKENVWEEWIVKSKRKIKTMTVKDISMDDADLIFIWSILRAHGDTIETLTFSSSANITPANSRSVVESRASYLIAIFECVPHLKTLNWSFDNVKFTNWYTHEPILQELESLSITLSAEILLSIHFANMFTPNTIRKFEITRNSWKHLGHFIERQSTIKNLSINHENMQDSNIFKNLELDTFTFTSNEENEIRLYSFLRSHNEIKKFYLYFSTAKPTPLPQLQALCEMKNLENIILWVHGDILNEMRQLSNLPSIKQVFFDIDNLDDDFQLMEVATIRLDKVESMVIVDESFTHIVNSVFLETAGINWPNLNKLDIYVPLPENGGIDVLNEFLDNFPHLETLELCYKDDENAEHADDDLRKGLKFYWRFQQYPYLKNLNISGLSLDHFQDLIIALPNLESLTITGDYSPHAIHLMAQLDKLDELEITFLVATFARLQLQDVEALKKLCRNLETFEIEFDASLMFADSLQNHLLNFSHFIDVTRENNKVKLKDVLY